MKKILYLTAFLFAVSPAFADNTCGENCTWEIVNGELKIHGTGNMNNYSYQGAPWNKYKFSIQKITIDDGITSIGKAAFHELSRANSISLPSTLKSIGTDAFRDSGIHSIKLPEGFERLEGMALTNISGPIELPSSIKYVGTSNRAASIINATDNCVLSSWAYRGWNGAIANTPDIVCKGDMEICKAMLQDVKKDMPDIEAHLSYYTGLNKDGNWEVWSDEGQMIYEDASMQKPLVKYDFDGNQTGLYQYDSGGNLVKAVENGVTVYQRRIYTPTEATAAVQNNKNTFSIIYR